MCKFFCANKPFHVKSVWNGEAHCGHSLMYYATEGEICVTALYNKNSFNKDFFTKFNLVIEN
jgi:hypothetical protein